MVMIKRLAKQSSVFLLAMGTFAIISQLPSGAQKSTRISELTTARSIKVYNGDENNLKFTRSKHQRNTTATKQTKDIQNIKKVSSFKNAVHILKKEGELIRRKDGYYKRTGSSLSKDLRRQPAIWADDLNKTSDWWKAFLELADDLKSTKREYRCSFMKLRGNWWDCNTSPYKVQNPCLVYSFGIGNDFRFDDAMAKLGCEVHSFDPSMNVEDYKRKSGVYFHKLGIGNTDEESFIPRKSIYTEKNPNMTWEVKSMASIMSLLGHKNLSIDILKIDIEGYEWEVLEKIHWEKLIPRIKQLNIEFHIFPHFPPKQKYIDILKIYQTLWKLNFKRFYTSAHQLHNNKDKPHLQADVSYVNMGYMDTLLV